MGLVTKTILRGGLPSPTLESSWPVKKRSSSFQIKDFKAVARRRSWPLKKRACSFATEDESAIKNDALPVKKETISLSNEDVVKTVIKSLERGFDEKENHIQKALQMHCPPPIDSKILKSKPNKKKKTDVSMTIRELQSHCGEVKGGYWDLEDVWKRPRVSKKSHVGVESELFEDTKRRQAKTRDICAEICVQDENKKSSILQSEKKTKTLSEGRRRRRRCMRCVEQGNDPKEAMECPGSKSSIGGDGCLYFHGDGSRTEPPKAPKKKVSSKRRRPLTNHTETLPEASTERTTASHLQTEERKVRKSTKERNSGTRICERSKNQDESTTRTPAKDEDEESFAKREYYRKAVQAAKDFLASEEGRKYKVEDGITVVLV